MKFTDTHEWTLIERESAKIGISDHAQKELGEIVYVELPNIGDTVQAGEEIVVLESTKAASDIYAPLSGRVIAVNEKVKEDPSLLNRSPEKEGWLVEIQYTNASELDSLLDHQQYRQLIMQT